MNTIGSWCLKPEARKRLAEKYCLYMHGVSKLQRALDAAGYKSGLKLAQNEPVSGLRRPLSLLALLVHKYKYGYKSGLKLAQNEPVSGLRRPLSLLTLLVRT